MTNKDNLLKALRTIFGIITACGSTICINRIVRMLVDTMTLTPFVKIIVYIAAFIVSSYMFEVFKDIGEKFVDETMKMVTNLSELNNNTSIDATIIA